jgi:hypothetical protein
MAPHEAATLPSRLDTMCVTLFPCHVSTEIIAVWLHNANSPFTSPNPCRSSIHQHHANPSRAEVDERSPARGRESGASQILYRGIQRVRHVFRTDAVLGEQRGVHLAGDRRTVFVSHRPESYRENHIISTGTLKAYHIVPMTFWKPQKSIAAARCTV